MGNNTAVCFDMVLLYDLSMIKRLEIFAMLISKFNTLNISEKIKELEARYDIFLPEQYRKFLIKYNGGETPETYFRIRGISSDICAFYGIGDVEYSFSSIEEFIPDFLKRQFFPIARDAFGNYIVIGLDEKKNGQIWFCDHEELFKATFLTVDFREFVKKAKSQKLGPAYTMTIEEREKMLIANGHADNITDKLRKNWQEIIDKYGHMKQERVIVD